ncbi:hypothetical protein LJ739_08630 [Aestuariibacter halophilus]|uniref:LPXTG cell wall anchor domain-containing protein n=1 Tax=Fluctibacter halophilus TaxID=226011 RepID=A0ABS8G706_9ALTE|nr:hypothetical protein [Aestuariibacter halophilus]
MLLMGLGLVLFFARYRNRQPAR